MSVYKCAIGSFDAFLKTEGHGRSLAPRQVVETVRSYIRWLRLVKNGGKLDTSTIALYLAALSTYFEWEILEGCRKVNPIRDVRLPRMDADKRALLNGYQIAQMFQAADQVTWPWDPDMARAYLSLLAGNGLRAGETRKLADVDLDVDGRLLYLWDQKNKERSTLPVPESFIPYHEAWLAKRDWFIRNASRARSVTNRYLFLSPHWEFGEEGPFILFRRIFVLAGLRVPGVYPHALRHFAITSWSERAGLKAANVLARQKNLSTTAKYDHPTEKYLRYVVDAAAVAILHPERPLREDQQMVLRF